MTHKEKHRVWSAEHYQNNKEAYRKRDKLRKEAVRRWFLDLKRNLCCLRCGEKHPACLEFHHRDATQKEINISNAISNRWSPERIKKEIEKCDVLCSNCHQKHHWEEESRYQKMWLESEKDSGYASM